MDVPQSTIDQVRQLLVAMGPIISLTLVSHVNAPLGSVYVYRITCRNGAALEQISFKDGKINGLYFKPAP